MESAPAVAKPTIFREELVGLNRRPQVVRKKSGEIVRPILHFPFQRKWSTSAQDSQTSLRSVHFDSHKHIRHFLTKDRPDTLRAASSLTDDSDDDHKLAFRVTKQQVHWELVPSNTLVTTIPNPVCLERIFLIDNGKCLRGSVLVANFAFGKAVTCRYTLDFWRTLSEVTAKYYNDIQAAIEFQEYDRFIFTVQLGDVVDLGNKTFIFCLRYDVNGQQFWDNNKGCNFQLNFRKKYPSLTSNPQIHYGSKTSSEI